MNAAQLAARLALLELDGLTGPLPAGVDACRRWGEALAAVTASHPLLVSDRLRDARRAAKAVAALGRGGGSRG